MPLTQTQIDEVADVLRKSLRFKLTTYNPEPNNMPFHTRLLGSDRLALYSFIHSLSTNFGTAIFEHVAAALARPLHKRVETQAIAGEAISEDAYIEIHKIMNELTTAVGEPDKGAETERLRLTSHSGAMTKVSLTRVDVLIETHTDEIFMFDLKTAKPNKSGFQGYKQMLLEWTAAALASAPEANITAAIAIPYNPYEPKPYSRWTMRGMLDVKPASQLFVGKEFWDFIGGEGAYEQLLDVFEAVGIELRSEIDARFAEFK
jgi:type II restriction enzyme